MSNNLRIIYDNLVDYSGTTISASSTASSATVATNLLSDTKSLVWRTRTFSTSNYAKANLIVTLPSSQIVGGIVLPFCNMSSVATIRVRGYTGATISHAGTTEAPTVSITGGTLNFDSGSVVGAPYQVLGLWNWGSLPLGVNSYAYGGGTYGRVWIPEVNQVNTVQLVIEIEDTQCTSQYLEFSRLIVGSYWTPKYNTSYGLSTAMKDMSAHIRTESGDLVTIRSTRHNALNFDLKWLTPEDRLDFTRIVKGNGIAKPLLISLFPDNSTDWVKEQTHQIYGKLSQLSPISHPIYEMYSTTIDIEEV